jgi:predicted metal-dependent enzyme (double-stranded beta helix superfamily)
VFEIEGFIADCRSALAADPSHKLVREVVARAVAAPGEVLRALGEPARAGINTLYRSPDLTILNLVWGPRMLVMPHNHTMWAVIGIYSGVEDNIFWRRTTGERSIEAAGARSLRERDAEALGRDVIHSVLNPIQRLTAAIHVYGGDFFAAERSEWDPETLCEHRYDVEKTRRMFEDANAALVRA